MSDAHFLTATSLTARHGFFTRNGGVSTGDFQSLQCGFGAASDAPENVIENRRRALGALSLDAARLVAGFQVHSADAMLVAEPFDRDAAPKLDGLATRRGDIALGVLTADCAPVLLEDAEARVVGACHAGWRGALGGVVEATIARMVEAGAAEARIRAAIGPCIGPEAYEVGPEFEAAFLDADADNARFFRGPAEGAPGDRRRFDLAGYIADVRLAGFSVEQIGRCTYSEPAVFYSHRRGVHRGEADYGRLISIIAPIWG